MPTLDGYYLNPHIDQYDGSPKQFLNCTPASVSNGANASSGGAIQRTPGGVRALLRTSEETTPGGGWSVADADNAMAKVGVPFSNRSDDGRPTSAGWAALTAVLNTDHYAILQGDSDQFGNSTCSGRFDGYHCIGVHPATRTGPNGVLYRWIDDPICQVGRWEYDSVLRKYAAKFNTSIRFGFFETRVPKMTSTHHVLIARNARIRLYTLSGSCIATWTDRRWDNPASSAPCAKPIYRRTCNGKSGATTALVTDGAFAGRYIRVGAMYGVTVEP